MMRGIFIVPFVLTFTIVSTALGAGEHPDALYQKGRFEEAEKAYAEADMDHPKDIRFRYNRGCAAYQKADFDGAMASFASVLKRAESDETRFKTTFNLGNTAFKKGDLSSAAAYFKQALALKPDSEDARVNLELTLREIEKNKGSQKEQPGQESSKDASPQSNGSGGQDKKDDTGSPQQDEDKKKSPPEQETSPAPDNTTNSSEHRQDGQEKQDETTPSPEGDDQKKQQPPSEPGEQSTAQEDNRDLSGRLEPMEAMAPQEDGGPNNQPDRQLDRRKADAFLNNVKEDRSRFLQYGMGEEKGRGVASGKDW